jgi:inner membrane protein
MAHVLAAWVNNANALQAEPEIRNCLHKEWAQYTITAHAVQSPMFNSTHTFVGIAVARTAPKRWVPYATVTAVIAANLPDIDFLAELGNMPGYLERHRGITHTFVGVPFLSLALAASMYFFTGKFWRTFAIALIAMATHPVLDYANTYGLRPFLPFNGKWYYGDTLFIIDPYFDLILLAGILAGHYFKSSMRVITWVSLALVIVYIGFRVELRNDARSQLARYTARLPGFQQSAVMPRMLDPWTWDGIIETTDEMRKVSISALDGVGVELARMPKGHPIHVSEFAATARSASVLLGFARFPVIRVEGMQSGYRVTFLDFRFYREDANASLAAEVILDNTLHVVKESLAFDQTIN